MKPWPSTDAIAVGEAIGLDTSTAALDDVTLCRGNRGTLHRSIAAIHQAVGKPSRQSVTGTT